MISSIQGHFENEFFMRIKILFCSWVAEYLSVSEKTLEEWRRTGKGPRFAKREDGHVSYLDRRIKEFMDWETMDFFISPAKTAEMLGVSTRTLRLWEKGGKGPRALRLMPRFVRYPLEEVKAFCVEKTA